MKAIYPCIISWNKTDKVYDVNFPDIAHCYTNGYDLYEAVEMAEDVLNLTLWKFHGDMPPVPSDIKALELQDGDIATLIRADTDRYAIEMEKMNREKIYRGAPAVVI